MACNFILFINAMYNTMSNNTNIIPPSNKDHTIQYYVIFNITTFHHKYQHKKVIKKQTSLSNLTTLTTICTFCPPFYNKWLRQIS